jgi:hypothetical protein
MLALQCLFKKKFRQNYKNYVLSSFFLLKSKLAEKLLTKHESSGLCARY